MPRARWRVCNITINFAMVIELSIALVSSMMVVLPLITGQGDAGSDDDAANATLTCESTLDDIRDLVE